MSSSGDRGQWIRFGLYEVNTAERIILRKGITLRLQDKPFDVLSLLLQNSGEIVDREELRRKLWPEGTYVNFEHGLAVAMHKLRAALDDSVENPRYIETVAGHGYRFILSVERPSEKIRTLSRALLIVLPFVGLASGNELDHVADGFTEELTAQLSKVMPQHLGVIGRTTAMCFKGTSKSIVEISKEVGADYLLEGSVRAQDGRLRLTAQLIRASDQSHVWTESVQGDGADAVHTQITLSDQISRAIGSCLFPGAPPSHLLSRSKHRPNEEAYQLFQQGCIHFPCGVEREGALGVMCFHQAIARDTEFVQPYALLGIAYTVAALFDSGIVTAASLPSLALQGKHFAFRALELDPVCGEAHCAVAVQKFHFGWDWRVSEVHFKKALELNSNFTLSHLLYASALAQMGLHREARVQLDMAMKLDPRSPFVAQWTGWTSYLVGDLEKAIALLEADLAVNSDNVFTNLLLGDTYIAGGRPERAIPLLRECFLASDGHTLANASLVCAYAKSGQREEALHWLKTLEDSIPTRSVSPYHHAMAVASLGEIDRSFSLLDKAVMDRSGWIPQLPIDPGFQALHADPRWLPLLERTSRLRSQRGL